MNKFLIVAVCFVAVTVSAQGPGGPKGEEYKKYLDACKAETGATDDDLKSVMTNQSPTEKGWCLMACLNKKSGLMGPDNKLILDKVQQEMAPMKEQNPELYAKLTTAMQQCRDQTESDPKNLESPCKAAKALGVCMKSKM